ncbi:GlxA family transcriptional regulator [Leisingera aquaemixtae]|uniref:Carnitine catabolism transcriptional activator n=1 Tax=Leisingera aquaemixtae TaxID=1396826 RepID=A0A0P1H5B1_9RHOB|nr:GlxA family transcriptional regulator [Leisingera aquaemixtae]UWQ23761.1 GlxA family transcriptional regulator [Leisingera aquaemixtae]UWQ36286.1 GlxA family transcriptional regulator [Leisingera aquaemixtae]UWQ40392.1 GlxA family transcriptional regulator [Leisingera aquaemixtae]UWQ44646.1 GlxA family transcriptional regulator [Leisingera aquaemixtae]CUH98040.1 Carnitine catabolism transcriptional activator [Leisingera aquaemixtae]
MKSAKNILQPENRPLKTALLVLDECNTLSFAAAVDPMRAANRLAGRAAFDWDYVSATAEPPMLTSGLTVPSIPLARLEGCELLIVVAGFQLARHATPSLLAGLRRIAATGATIAGIDGGPWLLAEAGLLDGHPATTHWEDLENFAARFPEVDARNDRFTVSEGRLTSGGATPAIEMMLHVIGARHGAGFAARVAGLFLYDGPAAAPRPQSRLGGRKHNALTAKANALMESALDEPLPLSAIAETLGTSPRSLQQQFRLRLNTTPQDHYLQLRLAEARRLVTDTNMPLMEVAMATGFTSQSSFARAFRTAHGTSARDLRQEQARPTAH